MATVRRIAPISAGKVMGMTYGLIGLIAGAIFALISLLGMGLGSAMSDSGDGAMGAIMGGVFGIGAVIILPLFYGVMGFIGGLIGAAIYNLVAGWVGGLEVDLA